MGIDDLIEQMKSISQWRVALKNEGIAAGTANAAYVDFLNVHAAQPGRVAAMDGSESAWQHVEQQTDANQLLVVEAEDFHRQEVQGVHRWVIDSSPAGYSGSGAVSTYTNWGTGYTADNISTWAARLDYPVSLTTSGTYRVWIRARAPGGVNDDLCWVGCNEDGSGAMGIAGFGSDAYTWRSATIEVSQAGESWFYLWVGADGLVVDLTRISHRPEAKPKVASRM